jgi:hypothetical protein
MSDYIITNGELLHYGVKGMKWGRRRAVARYKKSMNKTVKQLNKRVDDRKLIAYVKTDRAYDIEYDSKSKKPDYSKYIDQHYPKRLNDITVHELKNNKHYKKANEIYYKYKLSDVDDLVSQNNAFIEAFRQHIDNDTTEIKSKWV